MIGVYKKNKLIYFFLQVKEDTVQNYGRLLRIVSIACQLLPLLMKKYSAVMEDSVLTCKVWNRLGVL